MWILREMSAGFAFITKTFLCSATHAHYEISVWNVCIYTEPSSPLLKACRPTLRPSDPRSPHSHTASGQATFVSRRVKCTLSYPILSKLPAAVPND